MSNLFEEIKEKNATFIAVLNDLINFQKTIGDFEDLPTYMRKTDIENIIKKEPYCYYLNEVSYYNYNNTEQISFVDKNFFRWTFNIKEMENEFYEISTSYYNIGHKHIICYNKDNNFIGLSEHSGENFDNLNQDFLDIIRLKYDISLSMLDFEHEEKFLKKREQNDFLQNHRKYWDDVPRVKFKIS